MNAGRMLFRSDGDFEKRRKWICLFLGRLDCFERQPYKVISALFISFKVVVIKIHTSPETLGEPLKIAIMREDLCLSGVLPRPWAATSRFLSESELPRVG